jgi:hypothetical protein
MAGEMPMPLWKEVAMKQLLITLALLPMLNSSPAAEDNQRELGLSEVGLQLLLVPSGKLVPERISLALTNAATRSGVFRLPSPFGFTNSSRSSFAPFPPYLALVVKEPKSGTEEEFVLTSFRKLRGPGKRVLLKPRQVRRLEYPLNSFYSWGPDAPMDGSFRDCFKPGDVELEVRAEIFLVQQDGPRRVLSNPQTLRCSFPDSLFKGPFKSDRSRGESNGNRGNASKP